MNEDLKEKIAEIVEVVKTVPTNLQEKCFELLLLDHLSEGKSTVGGRAAIAPIPSPDPLPAAPTDSFGGGEDITTTDLHVKVRKFLEKYGLTIEQLNQLFFKEAGAIKPLYEDLRTTKTAECQIRIGLLLAFRNAFPSGEFTFSGEAVREECRTRKCYDGGNFSVNFKNNAKLFEGFDKYDSDNPGMRLSEEGRAELAALIKELK